VAKASERDQATSTALVRLAPEDERWLEYLAQEAAALPFHHPSWARVLTDSYGHPCFVLALADGEGRLHGGMPVIEIRRRFQRPRWVSLPFTDRCPPLATDAAMCGRLVDLADRSREDAGVVSLEFHADLPGRHVHRHARGVSHVLSLSSDPELTFRTFSRSQVQRNVRKAERSGLTLRRADSTEDLTTHFYALHLRTRRRLGIPVQPRYFFDHLWRHVLATERGFALLAYHGRVPVAGAVFLTVNRTVVYKFGASEPSSWPLRPNHLLFWDAIRWSCENGFATFDFGRSESANRGLRDFKSAWGAAEVPLLYATLGANPPRTGRLISSSMLPPLIRRGPLWLCRAIGEVAYPRTA
jgi:CelD/BcsL family acetyltransferase involved in cellulose biosynthesis